MSSVMVLSDSVPYQGFAMISFACPACSKPLKVKDEVAGKRVKCPGCGKALVVPSSVPTASGPSKAGPVQPSPGERTLPPGKPIAADGPTVSPAVPRPASQLGRATAGDDNENDGEDNSGAQYDFLAPAERSDEIGRLGGFRILKVLGRRRHGRGVPGRGPEARTQAGHQGHAAEPGRQRVRPQALLREAKTAAAIEHDHIVPILQVGEDRGVPFIAMPFLQGEPLDKRLKRERRLPVAEVLRIGRETAEGLAAAHERGLIHRDIKPANLWLEAARGRVKILDFGLARAAADSAQSDAAGRDHGHASLHGSRTGDAAATVDARCDLFSLGCVLYRLATGQAAVQGR